MSFFKYIDTTIIPSDATRVLDGLDRDYAPSPAGLGVTIAWGLPYFHRLVADRTRRLLPHDRRAGKPVLVDANCALDDDEVGASVGV